jgi:hypothetical protein
MLSFRNQFKFLLIAVLITAQMLVAQTAEPKQTDVEIVPPPDSLIQPFQSYLVRSALIPGWGQVEQGNNLRGAIIYSLTVASVYNTWYNLYWYDKTGRYDYRTRAKTWAAVGVQTYLFNMLDIVNSYHRKDLEPWPEVMFADKPMRSPWGAVTRSAMIPGWGQVYNDEYLKAGIALLLVADFGRKVYVNNIRYQRTGIKAYRDWRMTNSWYLGLTYFLAMVDSYVDAYLYRFDDMMELTMILEPVGTGVGFKANVRF